MACNFLVSFAYQGGGCGARVMMKLSRKFGSPRVGLECFQYLDVVESANDSPMDDHSSYSTPETHCWLEIGTHTGYPVLMFLLWHL